MNAPYTHKNIFLIMLIMLVSLSTFSTNLYVPALPSMVLLFHSSSAAVQESLVSFTYGFAVCMILSGILADAIGRKNTLLIGLLLYCVTSLIILFSHSIFSLILFRFLQGVGGCCGSVIARVIVRDLFDDKKAVGILALLSGGMAIAFMIAPMAGSFLVHFFSWRACFLFMFLIGLFLSLLVLFIYSESMSKNNKINFNSVFSKYLKALQSRLFLMHTLAISISWTGFFLIIMEYPFILMTQLHFSILGFGVIFSIILLAYLLGSRIARYLSYRNISSELAVLYGISIMLLASLFGALALSEIHTDQYIILTITGFLYLLGMGIQIPNSQFAAIPLEEKASATMTSLLYFIEMIIVAALCGFFKSHFAISDVVLWHAIFFSMLFLLCVYAAVVFYPYRAVLQG